MNTVLSAPARVDLEEIDLQDNTRELDPEHVKVLANSIALRGLIVPLAVRPVGGRYQLIAGHHRHAACRSLGLKQVEVTLREQEKSSADSAAENVLRKALTPLEEAHAVRRMLDEGYTLDGAASVLGWTRALVNARAQILQLPPAAQRLIGSGELPVSAVSLLTGLAEVSTEVCELAVSPVVEGSVSGEQFVNDPGWTIRYALREGAGKIFGASLGTISHDEIAQLRLGKRAQAAYAEAETLHRELDRYAYGPPVVRFAEAEVDQARAAGVLIEFEYGTPLIVDRSLLRELTKQAIERTLEELRARRQERAGQRGAARAKRGEQPTPQQTLESEHRSAMRELTAQAHGVNLDLGSALLKKLATVKADDMDVARFFAFGLLGPDTRAQLASVDRRVATIAANGIRLVIEEHRCSETPTRKDGSAGKTKITYADAEAATTWLWRFVEGARNAGELYGRTLVVFAAQAYALEIVLPASQRRSSVVPVSRKDAARKAFERLIKPALPGSYDQLRRALDREARRYAKRSTELSRHAGNSAAADPTTAEQ